MKKGLLLFAFAGIFFSFQQAQEAIIKKNETFYGEKFDPKGAMSEPEMVNSLAGKDEVEVKFKTKIIETCAKAGCWMTVQSSSNYPMWISMKDHAFGVPLSGASDLNCVVKGIAFHDTLSIQQQKHFAEDAHKSEAEINAITAPLPVIAVQATGVMIENYKSAH